jgi:hypothetical protein
VHKRKPKHNFTVTDLTRIVVTAWTKDDLMFTLERYRISLRLSCVSSVGQGLALALASPIAFGTEMSSWSYGERKALHGNVSINTISDG